MGTDMMMEDTVHSEKHWKSGDHEEHKTHGEHYEHDEHNWDDEHEIMTMADVSECLKKDFKEEIEDSKKYLCMSRIAECAGNDHDSYYLREMAYDEYTHATFIRDFMHRHNMCIKEEHEMCYMKLKEEMESLFQ